MISSYLFHPKVGGIEQVGGLLAAAFVQEGHELKVVTETDGPSTGYPYEVIRKPARGRLVGLVRWCDLYFQNNISLNSIWPLLLVRRPVVMAHHIWIENKAGQIGWPERFKLLVARFATNVAVSKAIGDRLGIPYQVIGNPYNDRVFKTQPAVERTKDLIYVGRLVSAKGVDDLVEALALLGKRQLRPTLTIVGDGPELAKIKARAAELGVDGQINFAGTKTGGELAHMLNEHRIMVVPSRWNEPFGIVAVEGIACGCLVVGSEGGGLKDAIGPCGLLYPNKDVNALADRLVRALTEPTLRSELQKKAPEHLARFTQAASAQNYLKLFQSLLARPGINCQVA